MRITEELRKHAEELETAASRKSEHGFSPAAMKLFAIADRIDAEHEEAIQQALMGEGGVPATDENMAENGWIRLPKDADGVPIYAGDVLTDGEYKFKVFELVAFRDGSWSIRNEDGIAWAACDVTHYHVPTVEDVLREFAEKITDSQIPDVHPTYEEAIAEYVQKLQLREED